MSGFKTPPLDDFQAYANLVAKQGDHLGRLVQWSGKECAKTDGLSDGPLLAPLAGVVTDASNYFNGKLSQCQRGMGVIGGKIQRTSDDYRTVDTQAAQDLQSIYPTPYSGFPDISSLPGGSYIGDFTDKDVADDIKNEPAAEEGDGPTHLSLVSIILKAREYKNHRDVLIADTVFTFINGSSIEDLLFKPLAGDWGQLHYLRGAYDSLGDGCYTVAGTLRKGSWKLGSEWQGQAATAFDSYLFQWTMGMGGIGDAAKVVAKAYQDAQKTIAALAHMALNGIDSLIRGAIKKLATKAAATGEGDAVIEGVGLGPEDPVADVIAAGFTGFMAYQLYDLVSEVASDIENISKYYDQMKDALKTLQGDVHKVIDELTGPTDISGMVGSLIDQEEQRGFDFEKNGGWSPAAGASRIAMLPAA
ncbi:WXG100 family type VII secretion target [Kitasatospora sp. RB6PN24]|uniref:WXG100 family type VII secretion target n=1 Tax=Kitasatospora humi TaxID=2893891 RepID=UPI001E314137|nr:WXG100 family type VII secretion target [Kitasatospora humi]MCC9312411.1 WXG100 family type VII secretion target [Kitasatospora humi]